MYVCMQQEADTLNKICTGTKDRNRTEKTWIVLSVYDSVQVVMTQPKVELKISMRICFLQGISESTNKIL